MKELTLEERQELEKLKGSDEVKLATHQIQTQNKERKKLYQYRWLYKKGLAIKAQQSGETNAC